MDGRLSIADRQAWAESQFDAADLGDVRRTRRLVKLGAQMAGNSAGSIPQQTERTADMKAAYRLFSQEAVTHEAICRPHWEQTRALACGLDMVFVVQDTAELAFTLHALAEGLAPVGTGRGRGLHQQNILAVDAVRGRPLGLLYQRHHRRKEAPQGETRFQLRQRSLSERESYWWVEAIRTVGRLPEGVCWVHVLDRGGDTFAVHDAIRDTHTDFIIRACKDRRIEPQGGHGHLFAYARSLPAMGLREVTARCPSSSKRQATLQIAAGTVTLLPSLTEPELRHLPPITCQVVRAWEQSPPADMKGLEWILLTSLPTRTYPEATRVAEGYELRWLIEEFHKCEKTGCRVQERQLTHTDRLEPLIGLLSVLAVYLLQLKFVARQSPQTPARELFDDEAVMVMARYLKVLDVNLSVGQFWRGIGRLGGHPGRKGDGPLGWLRAWRGWQVFQWMLLGAQLSVPGPSG